MCQYPLVVFACDPTVPIIFLSAKNEKIDVVVGLELGADDFIRKPFGKRNDCIPMTGIEPPGHGNRASNRGSRYPLPAESR